MSDVRRVLVEAKELVLRSPAPTSRRPYPLAVSATGERCKPASTLAVAWSSVGALCRVASDGNPERWSSHTEAGWQAFILLCEVATEHGYACTNDVDKAGAGAVAEMFARAISLADETEQRPRRAPARGTHPRGVPAA
jgi:hypothetical protein